MVCGKCAAIGTNSKGPGSHSPSCSATKAPDLIFRDALRAVRERHGDIFPAATVEKFAFARFERAYKAQALENSLVGEDIQAFAEFLLLDECLLFAEAKL